MEIDLTNTEKQSWEFVSVSSLGNSLLSRITIWEGYLEKYIGKPFMQLIWGDPLGCDFRKLSLEMILGNSFLRDPPEKLSCREIMGNSLRALSWALLMISSSYCLWSSLSICSRTLRSSSSWSSLSISSWVAFSSFSMLSLMLWKLLSSSAVCTVTSTFSGAAARGDS